VNTLRRQKFAKKIVSDVPAPESSIAIEREDSVVSVSFERGFDAASDVFRRLGSHSP
jgi:hypothetical protein